jgi:uncharacterized protein
VKRVAVVALAVVAGLYLLVAAFLFFGQRALIFPAPPGSRAPAGPVLTGPGFRAIWIAPPPGGPVVVHFHGNGEDLADQGSMIDLLRSLGAGVLAVEYPGYGVARADGPPGEEACYRAGAAAVAYLRERLHRGEVFVQGQSLGSGVAAELAARGAADRLVLISPFTSIPGAASSAFPWLPARLLVRHRFDTRAKARRIAVPVLLVHGSDDEIIPASMSADLERSFPHAKRVLIPDGHHNDLLLLHARELRAALGDFFAR